MTWVRASSKGLVVMAVAATLSAAAPALACHNRMQGAMHMNEQQDHSTATQTSRSAPTVLATKAVRVPRQAVVSSPVRLPGLGSWWTPWHPTAPWGLLPARLLAWLRW